METQFEPNEEETLEELRKLIARVAGVTLVGNYLTLRFGSSKKRFKSVSMQIMEVDSGDYDTCYICDERGQNFHKSQARIDTSNNEEYVCNMKLCPDCYCPQ